jgi:rare lipoprotein A
MLVPATPPAPAAPSLAPVGVVSAAPASLGTPQHTTLEIKRRQLNVLEDHRASVTGRLLEGHTAARSGRVVTLQVLAGRGWKTVALAHTGSKGRFRLGFAAKRLGSRWVRLRFKGDALERSAHRRVGRLNVFRLAGASWYGGGGGLACGGQLTSSTLGVANKTLPCGTLVTLRYGGHSVRVPVVDRGPFVAGREFDLTEATKRALGFGDTGQVWSTG